MKVFKKTMFAALLLMSVGQARAETRWIFLDGYGIAYEFCE